jgi:hypothetical protein
MLHDLRGWACLLPGVYDAPLLTGGLVEVPQCRLISRRPPERTLPTAFIVPRGPEAARLRLVAHLAAVHGEGLKIDEPLLPDDGDSLSLDVEVDAADWPRLARGGQLVFPASVLGSLTIGGRRTAAQVRLEPCRLPVVRPE